MRSLHLLNIMHRWSFSTSYQEAFVAAFLLADFTMTAARFFGSNSNVPRHLAVPQRQAYCFFRTRVIFCPSIDNL